MSARLAAGMAVLCTVIASQAIAAERRPVAVIDLSNTEAGRAKAQEIDKALNNHADLKPHDDSSISYELYAELVDSEAQAIGRSRKHLQDAEIQFENREFAAAAETARLGQNELSSLAPTPQVVKLHAALTFVLAQARLGERKPAEATALFRLVHQLDSDFQPNAARTLPEVISAFEAAKKIAVGTGTIAIAGTGTVTIDGKQVGTAPAWFPAPAGLHFVWLTGAERDPRVVLVSVSAGQKTEAEIPDAPTPPSTKVRRARLALKAAPDPFARASAMNELARLVAVRDAVLITMSNNRLIIQTWRDGAVGFMPLREIKATDQPADLLEPLAPKPIVVVKDPDPPPPPPRVEKKWWKKKRYWAIAAAMLGVTVGSIAVYDNWDRRVGFDQNAQFPIPSGIAR